MLLPFFKGFAGVLGAAGSAQFDFVVALCHFAEAAAADPCSSSPCLNSGTCSNHEAGNRHRILQSEGFVCVCEHGYSKTQCETADPCEVPAHISCGSHGNCNGAGNCDGARGSGSVSGYRIPGPGHGDSFSNRGTSMLSSFQ